MPAIAFIALVILCLLSLIQFLMNPTEWTKFFLSILTSADDFITG